MRREPVDWVGNAWGGHVGIVFAATWPDRCRTPRHVEGHARRTSGHGVRRGARGGGHAGFSSAVRTSPQPAVQRVPKLGSSSARASASAAPPSAMTTSGRPRASRARAQRTLGTMPPAMTPSAMSRSDSRDGERRDALTVGAPHAVGVGQQQQSPTERTRDGRRRVVRVDVADDARRHRARRAPRRAAGPPRGARQQARCARHRW